MTSTAQTFIPRLSRNRISVAFSLLILAFALFALYLLLGDADLAKVGAALKAQPARKIALAGVFVVAGTR